MRNANSLLHNYELFLQFLLIYMFLKKLHKSLHYYILEVRIELALEYSLVYEQKKIVCPLRTIDNKSRNITKSVYKQKIIIIFLIKMHQQLGTCVNNFFMVIDNGRRSGDLVFKIEWKI